MQQVLYDLSYKVLTSVLALALIAGINSTAHAQVSISKILLQADSLEQLAQNAKALTLLNKYAGSLSRTDRLRLQNKKATVLIGLGKFSQADSLLSEAEKKAMEIAEASDLKINMLLSKALVKVNRGYQQEALEVGKEALGLAEKRYGVSHAITAQALTRLGLIYWDLDNNQQALEYYQRALVTYKSLPQNSFSKTEEAGLYNDMGLVLAESAPSEAMEYYEKALKVYLEVFGQTHPKVANAYLNISYLERKQQNYFIAMLQAKKSLGIWQSVYPNTDHPNEAFVSSFIGQLHADEQRWTEAQDQQEKALAIYQNVYGERHPKIAQIFNLLGTIQAKQGAYKEALELFQQALIANMPNFSSMNIRENPKGQGYYNPMVFLNTLLLKSESLEGLHYTKSLRLRDLQQAHELLLQCDAIIEEERQVRVSREDKLALGGLASEIYAKGVQLCLAIAEISLRPKYYQEQAFFFAERNKAAVLSKAIADTKAKSYANIPDALLEQERVLKANIANTEQQLGNLTDPAEEVSIRKKRADLKREYQSFIEKMEKDYPQYYNLKYQTNILTAEQLQQGIPPSTAIVSYFIGRKQQRLYAFIVTKKGLEVWNTPLNKRFDNLISGFRKGITYQIQGAWQEIGEQLYEQLFPRKITNPSIDHLIIIPDGLLGGVPYEALLTEKSEEGVAHKDLPFLLKKYSISYAYATSILYQSKGLVARVKPKNVLLCAPIQFSQMTHSADDDFGLNNLPGTEREVNMLESLMTEQGITSSTFTQEEAHEGVFKQSSLKNYDILHLATHGIVDQENPEESKVFLFPFDKEDGKLRAGEIYNLKTQADLVVFSACETGLGKVVAGEGIVGLSRALLYAGAKNVTVSLWSVADRSTAELMTDFYRQICSNTQAYHKAMKVAKLTMLESEEFSSPYYWSAFILIGY